MRKHRIKYSKEPILHVHRYIVAVITVSKRPERNVTRTRFFYTENKKEARAIAHKARPGSVVEIYSAVHNFVEGWM
jgi:hypothetical protein